MPYKDVVTRRKARRDQHRKHRERILQKEREYRANNPSAYRATRLKHRYGLTHEQYQDLFNAQSGVCALCLERPAADVDHCHDTGRIRGLLCRACNIGIGMLGDNIEGLERAIEYLKKSE